jgi:predicted nucleic acid-binding protein
MFLLDVNALFAALNELHTDHLKVTRWLLTTERYASCGMTQIGVFRLLIMPSTMCDSPLKPSDAHRAIARFAGSKHHAFIPCPALSSTDVGRTRGHKAAFDDYLVQIANDAGHTFATLDRALTARWPERTFLIT